MLVVQDLTFGFRRRPLFERVSFTVGAGELVTLFWASEIFDPNTPDTVILQVANLQGGNTPCV